jgi:hypothetical protein
MASPRWSNCCSIRRGFSKTHFQGRRTNLQFNSMTPKVTETELLKALQMRAARIAMGPFTMRGRGSKGAVRAGREFVNVLSLARFGTSDSRKFKSALDTATFGLKEALPRGSRYWGLARKGLNIFLRDCLYTVYLRNAYSLHLAERYLEVPLDSFTGRELSKLGAPRWRTVRGLKPELSDEYQAIASQYADSKRIARVHLDVFWWGSRQHAEL